MSSTSSLFESSSMSGRKVSDISSDYAIARALANEEQNLAKEEVSRSKSDGSTNRSTGANNNNNDDSHPSINGDYPGRLRNVMQGNYLPSTVASMPSSVGGKRTAVVGPLPGTAAAAAAAVLRSRIPTHMCVVPCVIGDNVCVEMMVDTGAQSSVMSLPLAKQMGLISRLDRSERGVAAGVGRAAILGKLRNVICEFGHVEFAIDFIVLEVTDSILLLGLDQMKKYKCIVDLENDKLVFGGTGGVEVPFLPPNEKKMSSSHFGNNPITGCPVS